MIRGASHHTWSHFNFLQETSTLYISLASRKLDTGPCWQPKCLPGKEQSVSWCPSEPCMMGTRTAWQLCFRPQWTEAVEDLCDSLVPHFISPYVAWGQLILSHNGHGSQAPSVDTRTFRGPSSLNLCSSFWEPQSDISGTPSDKSDHMPPLLSFLDATSAPMGENTRIYESAGKPRSHKAPVSKCHYSSRSERNMEGTSTPKFRVCVCHLALKTQKEFL